MGKRVVWSKKAINDRRSIFDYWFERTGSTAYPKKLRLIFKEATEKLKDSPFLGRKSNTLEFCFLVVKDYKMFYAVTQTDIVILAVFDTRQDPDNTPY